MNQVVNMADTTPEYRAKLAHRAEQIRLEQQAHPALIDPQVIQGIHESQKILIPAVHVQAMRAQLDDLDLRVCALERQVHDVCALSLGWYVYRSGHWLWQKWLDLIAKFMPH